MGQKINPVCLRLQNDNRHFDSCWYSQYFYKECSLKDLFLRNYLDHFLKCLKFPSGRYSIQHLQKKTRIYNWISTVKKTREWRSRILKRSSPLSKKNRYFTLHRALQPSMDRSRSRWPRYPRQEKCLWFYTACNQYKFYKIQKKITCFQNPLLWYQYSPYKLEQNLEKNQWIKGLQGWRRGLMQWGWSRDEKKNFYRESHRKNLGRQGIQRCTEKNWISHLSFNRFHVSKTVHGSNSLLFLYHLDIYKWYKGCTAMRWAHNPISLKKRVSIPFRLQAQSPALLNFLPITKKKSAIIEKNKVIPLISKKSTINSDPRLFCANFSIPSKYRQRLQSMCSRVWSLDTHLYFLQTYNDWQHANFLADEIVYFLEKRIIFRRLKNCIGRQLSKISEIRGVRITCSGRGGGKSKKAQRAKIECFKYGQTPLQVFSRQIDFSVKAAQTSWGTVGVKVWICYN